MIAILGAMQVEVDGLMKELSDLQVRQVGGQDFFIGKIAGHDVVLSRCGVGKVNAAVCTQTLILSFNPQVVINTGVAGSLSERLDILDVAVATDAVQHDYDTTPLGEPVGALSVNGELVTHLPCDEGWNRRLLAAAQALNIRAIPARIASGDRFITRREDKQHIVQTFSAEACEMEGAAIAQVCHLSKTPCAILRAISDSTDEDHQMEFERFTAQAAENNHRILMRMLSDLESRPPQA